MGLLLGHSQTHVVGFVWRGETQAGFAGHSHWQVLGLSCVFGGPHVMAGHWHWHVVGLKNDFGSLHAALQVLSLAQKFGLAVGQPQVPPWHSRPVVAVWQSTQVAPALPQSVLVVPGLQTGLFNASTSQQPEQLLGVQTQLPLAHSRPVVAV